MDEVDKIVLSSLSDIGYIPKENVTNLKLYTFGELLEMTIYCLRVIRPEASFPTSLPPMMSSRYQLCARFAEICKELGYKRDIGYHTFMYNNINDIRNVLVFLVEHLPKKSLFEKPADGLKGEVSVKLKISEKLKDVFISKVKSENSVMHQSPYVSVNLETGTLLPNQKIDCKPVEWRDFVVQELPFIDEQLPMEQSLLPSIITLNANGLVNPAKLKSKLSKFANSDDFLRLLSSRSCGTSDYMSALRLASNIAQADADGTIALDKLKIDNDIEGHLNKNETPLLTEADEAVSELRNEISEMELQIVNLKAKLNEFTQSNEIAKKKLQERISHESSLQQSIALLPDFENNVSKLESANEKCRTKIRKLKVQWKQHKGLLLDKRTELLAVADENMGEKNKLMQTISEARKELFEITEKIQKRSVIEQRLKDAEVGSGVQRSEFITRILEMIKNIKKQEGQIDNILNDMKFVQKEINTLSGKIERSFAVADQVISSNSDELSRESHKLIVTLHKDVSDILKMIDETGKYTREIKDLEDQVRDGSNNVEEALKQVVGDIEKMLGEQLILLDQIKKKSDIDSTH